MRNRVWSAQAAVPVACAFGVAFLVLARPHREESTADAPRPAEAVAPDWDDRVPRMAAHTEAMRAVGRLVLDGRLSLAGAAAVAGWLEDRLQADPDRPLAGWRFPSLAPGPGGHPDADRLWLRVMNAAAGVTEAECPARLEVVSAALEDEFRSARACGRVPDRPAVQPGECERLYGWAADAAERGRRGDPPAPLPDLDLVKPEPGAGR